MTVTTFSSREFNQDTSRAKKTAVEGPIFITDRGKPPHVLLSIDDYYHRRPYRPRNIADALTLPSSEEIEFNPRPMTLSLRPADLG